MAKYRKKSVMIEALQLRWNNWSEMREFAGVGKLSDGKPERRDVDGPSILLLIPTSEGVMRAEENDWVIRSVTVELKPCKPDIFAATYELVE